MTPKRITSPSTSPTGGPFSAVARRRPADGSALFSALGLVLLLVLVAAPAAASSGPTRTGRADVRYATLHNFAPKDLLNGDDGLPPSPAAPLRYGAPTLAVDDRGNGIEEHEATISYFNGKYYKYSSKWACGQLVYFAGNIPGQTRPDPYPPGDYGGQCGISTYSSDDLTDWHLENISQPTLEGKQVPVAKPNVVWSPGLGKYLMWIKQDISRESNLQPTGGFYYAAADTPAGPWGKLMQATGEHLAHDFDLVTAPDGTGWIATDSFSGSYDPDHSSLPLWDVWVQKLNPDMTGTIGQSIRVMSKAHFEGIGFAEHDGHWYLTGGPTCANCQVPVQYMKAPTPLGPWSNEAGDTGSALHEGTVISDDGCGGQNKGLNMLPSAAGDVVLSGIFGYRTGPTDYLVDGHVAHGDNSQAIASTYWQPLQFDHAHRIKPFTCPATVKVPLAGSVHHRVAAPDPYQPDCRVRSGSMIEQTRVRLPGNRRALSLPVFQRTDNLGPYAQDGPVLQAPLTITVKAVHGTTRSMTYPPADISWAPENVEVPLGKGFHGTHLTVTLSTTARNGCYGVLVHPKTASSGDYRAVRNDVRTPAPQAQLLISGA